MLVKQLLSQTLVIFPDSISFFLRIVENTQTCQYNRGESVKETLSKLYRLQVLADQLMTTHKQADELKKLRDLNESDYQSLLRLLNQQQEGLNEALRLKQTI